MKTKNNSLRIGITGQAGFIGTHLQNTIKLFPERYESIPFSDDFFLDIDKLNNFISKCDVLVHLAAMNRNPDQEVLYDTNVKLVAQIIDSLEKTRSSPHVIFSSSTQEDSATMYGKSKLKGRQMIEEWATKNCAPFTGLVVPNVFGPFGRPNYNSFIATFCHELTHGKKPTILQDSEVNLIYVGTLCELILNKIDSINNEHVGRIETCNIPADFKASVSEILSILKNYHENYFMNGIIPELDNTKDINLFNTFRSFIELESHFPSRLKKNEDSRGIFVETMKLSSGGQISFSTTNPGITRGNHFHTRKIERFIVIKGKAKIQLRKIGTDNIINFSLDGDNPSYVDIPIWYAHNITNIGDDELFTQFWTNEWFDQKDPDTYFDSV